MPYLLDIFLALGTLDSLSPNPAAVDRRTAEDADLGYVIACRTERISSCFGKYVIVDLTFTTTELLDFRVSAQTG